MIIYVLEILFYELIDLVPNLFLAFVPFRNYLRFSKLHTALIILFLYAGAALSRILAHNNQKAAVLFTIVWVILYLLFYLSCIRCAITKLLFILLNILNYGSFVVIIYSYFAYHKFPYTADEPYSFLSSLVLLLVYLLSYPVMFYLMQKKARDLIEFPENNHTWRYLWLVPATFCLAYYYNLYSNGGIVEYSGYLRNVLFAVFFNLGALFVTFLVTHLLNESNTNLTLKAENYQLIMNAKQYELLTVRMEDARRARHDLRQSLTVIQSYLSDNNKDGLTQYLSQYISTLPSDAPIVYCDNYALNALIVYYESIAREHRIRFEVEIEYPSSCCITDTDVTVLFGNLIENAIEACSRQKNGDRFISLHVKTVNNMLAVTLDNSYSETIQQVGGYFLSSKSKRTGIGTSSIKVIAEKYHGIVSFDFDGRVFHASVMLNLSTYE